jgi:hypothetical protein
MLHIRELYTHTRFARFECRKIQRASATTKGWQCLKVALIENWPGLISGRSPAMSPNGVEMSIVGVVVASMVAWPISRNTGASDRKTGAIPAPKATPSLQADAIRFRRGPLIPVP